MKEGATRIPSGVVSRISFACFIKESLSFRSKKYFSIFTPYCFISDSAFRIPLRVACQKSVSSDTAGIREEKRKIRREARSEEHTTEHQSLMRLSYAVFSTKT